MTAEDLSYFTGFERCGNCAFLCHGGRMVQTFRTLPSLEWDTWRCVVRSTPGPFPTRNPETDWCAEWMPRR